MKNRVKLSFETYYAWCNIKPSYLYRSHADNYYYRTDRPYEVYCPNCDKEDHLLGYIESSEDLSRLLGDIPDKSSVMFEIAGRPIFNLEMMIKE